MSGFNLPPGVSVRDIEDAYGVEEDSPSCRCGLPLPSTPQKIRQWSEQIHCDGKIHETHQEYGPESVAILGDEYEGQSYLVRWMGCEPEPDGNFTEHAAHYYEVMSGVDSYYSCKCGHTTVISEV